MRFSNKHRYMDFVFSLSRCLLLWFVLISLTPTGAVFEPNKTTNWTTKYRHTSRSKSRSFSRMLRTGQTPSVKSTHLRARPLSKDGWPACTLALYKSTKPCGFTVPNLPTYKLVMINGEAYDRCVYYNKNKANGTESEKVCESHGPGRTGARPDIVEYTQYLYDNAPTSRTNWYIGVTELNEGNWTFHGTDVKWIKGLWAPNEPNNGAGGQSCAIIPSYNKLWDDFQCDVEHFSICDHLAGAHKSAFTQSVASGRLVVGTYMTFKCEVRSSWVEEMKISIRNKNTGRELSMRAKIEMGVTWNKGEYQVADSSSTTLDCSYVHDDIPRCLAWCKFTILIIANDEMNGPFDLKCCGRYGCASKYETYEIMSSIEPVFVPQIPLELTNGQTWTHTCLARLCRDDKGSASLGVLKPTPNADDPEYVEDSISDWTITFPYLGEIVGTETGKRPVGISIDSVTKKWDKNWSGHHINLTFTLDRTLGRFHKATFFCRSDTSLERQPKGLRNRNTLVTVGPLVVKFLPGQPKMDVFWPGTDGNIYAGDVLRAKCTSLIGSLTTPPTLTWHLTLASGERKSWTIRYRGKVDTLPDWVELRQVPAVQQCNAGELPWFPTGVCVEFVNETYSWKDSISECRTRYSTRYDLATIEDSEYYEFLREKAGAVGYFIGLNDVEKEGDFEWWDKRTANVSAWGEWFIPTGNDTKDDTKDDTNDDTYWWNCIILHSRGIKRFDCDQPSRFICQSTQQYVASPLNFDPDKGLSLTSYITLSVRTLQDGATLQCSSTQEAAKFKHVLGSRKTGSDVSPKFKHSYGQLLPTLSVVESLVDSTLTIEVSCSAYVTEAGLMTLTLVYRSGVTRRWIIGGDTDIVVKYPTPHVQVHVHLDEVGPEVGRHIIASMNMSVSSYYHLSHVTCYPYDITDNKVAFTGYLSKSQLHATHLIDLKNLSSISLDDVIRALGPLASAEPLDVPEGGWLTHSWVMIALLLLATALLMNRDRITSAAVREDDEDGGKKALVVEPNPSNVIKAREDAEVEDDIKAFEVGPSFSEETTGV